MEDFQTDAPYVRIAVLEDPFHAQLVKGVLREEEIPFMMRSYHDTAYDGLFQAQKGWGEVRAPEAFREQILGILDDLQSGGEEKDFKELSG